MPDWLWRRAVELFLLAGRNGASYDSSNISWLTGWALNGTIPADKSAAPGERGKAVTDKVERFLNRN